MAENLASSGSLIEERTESFLILLPNLLALLEDGGSTVVGGGGGEEAVAGSGCELELEKRRDEVKPGKLLEDGRGDRSETMRTRRRSLDAMALLHRLQAKGERHREGDWGSERERGWAREKAGLLYRPPNDVLRGRLGFSGPRPSKTHSRIWAGPLDSRILDLLARTLLS
ncbi:hypothetical protein CRG98_016696 [Punica granatum]|uniref:Uncharacterized protein n=1 Tax=Punica granatum TaxID=22663 RepID=A0A2I0K2T6_PUNGR|nr:hypothetical protein CRG98_016696 [Punica granatum]